MNTNNKNGENKTQVTSMDRNEKAPIQELPHTGSQQHQIGADPQNRTQDDGKETRNTQAAQGPSKTKGRIALLALVLLVGGASALYYFEFVLPFESTDNAFIESFNGRFREECLNVHWFQSKEDAQEKIDEWRWEYNENRPHRSLKGLTPGEFARLSIHNPAAGSHSGRD